MVTTRTIDITDIDPVELTYRLRYDLDWSYDEIAAYLKVKPGTVMSRLSRGRKRHGRKADWVQRTPRTRNQHVYA